jgi:hypothetical protein
VEVSLDGAWIRKTNFSWTTNLNIAFYRNTIKELPADIQNTSLSYLGALAKGDAVTSLLAWQGSQTPQSKVIGNSDPRAFGGLTNTLRVGHLSAAFVLSYAWGNDILAESFSSRYYADQVNNQFPVKAAETPYYRIQQEDNNRTVYQGIRTIEDGSFLRLSRAMVSWHLSSVAKRLADLSDLEIFARGDNLFTLSRYSGINPEENITGSRQYDLMYTGTPLPTSVALGIKVVF